MRSAATVTDAAPGEPISIAAGRDAFLPASGVWNRYGITSMTLFRWLRDEKLGFPRPVYIGRFRFWRVSELEAFEAARPRVSAKQPEAA